MMKQLLIFKRLQLQKTTHNLNINKQIVDLSYELQDGALEPMINNALVISHIQVCHCFSVNTLCSRTHSMHSGDILDGLVS